MQRENNEARWRLVNQHYVFAEVAIFSSEASDLGSVWHGQCLFNVRHSVGIDLLARSRRRLAMKHGAVDLTIRK